MRALAAIIQRHSLHLLLLVIAGLVALGLVMLYSTGAFARQAGGDTFFFLKRQSIWLTIGIVLCVGAALTDYHFWKKTWWVWFVAAVILLALCFVPPIGLQINGARRWISLGFMNFQPSELAKLAAVVFLAWWYTHHEKRTRQFFFGFVFPGAIVSILLALIITEVDLGATALIGATTFAVMFVAGARLRILLPVATAGLAGGIYAATQIPERMGRLLAFLYPEKYPDEFYQQYQGLIGIGSGGVHGLGLGESRQKMLYLPEAHTDFIFTMIGEELGLKATLLVVAAYLVLVLAGFLIAMNAKDRFGMLLGFGAVTLIAIQAIVNIGVTTALFPNKGMPLPFISFGGSNLCICLLLAGILINIHRHGNPVQIPVRQVRLAAKVTPRI